MALKFIQNQKKKKQAPTPPKPAPVKPSIPKPTAKTNASTEQLNTNYAPEWVISAQEEIHTLIAQRHFEGALTLITQCEEYFAKNNSFVNSVEIIGKVSGYIYCEC